MRMYQINRSDKVSQNQKCEDLWKELFPKQNKDQPNAELFGAREYLSDHPNDKVLFKLFETRRRFLLIESMMCTKIDN